MSGPYYTDHNAVMYDNRIVQVVENHDIALTWCGILNQAHRRGRASLLDEQRQERMTIGSQGMDHPGAHA